MANKKFTDYTSKATAATTDIPLIVDPADNTSKRTTVGGLAPAIATSFASGAVSGSKLTDSTVTASKLDMTTFTPGFAQITSTFSATSSTPVAVTGLTSTVTISSGQRVKIEIDAKSIYNNNSNAYVDVSLWNGVVGSGTLLKTWSHGASPSAAHQIPFSVRYFHTSPTAGSNTYAVGLSQAAGGTANMNAAANAPAQMAVQVY